MTVQEYEERFRSSIPSLHQTFVAAHGPTKRDVAVDAFGLPRPWLVQ